MSENKKYEHKKLLKSEMLPMPTEDIVMSHAQALEIASRAVENMSGKMFETEQMMRAVDDVMGRTQLSADQVSAMMAALARSARQAGVKGPPGVKGPSGVRGPSFSHLVIDDEAVVIDQPEYWARDPLEAQLTEAEERAAITSIRAALLESLPPQEHPDTCPKCRHAWHARPCLNMASDNDCGSDCQTSELTRCASGRDGECFHDRCPQIRDDEPSSTGRHCPIDDWEDEEW